MVQVVDGARCREGQGPSCACMCCLCWPLYVHEDAGRGTPSVSHRVGAQMWCLGMNVRLAQQIELKNMCTAHGHVARALTQGC